MINAIKEQNLQAPAGRIGMRPSPKDQEFTYTVSAPGRLVTEDEFANIIIRESETGGTVYNIEKADDLQRIYDDIQTELRSQYVLGFYPSPDIKAGKWREVEVKVTEGKARTLKGYYP